MNTPTGDLTRAFDAIVRRWWVVLVSAVLGAVLAVATTPGSAPSTAEAVVPTPLPRVAGLVGELPQPSLDALVANLLSQATRDRLGEVARGASVVATPATDKTTVTIRVTSPTEAGAMAATAAFADDYARSYHVAIGNQIAAADKAYTVTLDALAPHPTSAPYRDGALARLADLTLQRELLQQIAASNPPVPAVRRLSSGSSSFSPALLLALGFGIAAAAVLGFMGLHDRRVRYLDDLESITGPGSVVARLGSPGGQWALQQAITSAATTGTVGIMPVGEAAVADLTSTVAEFSDGVILPAFLSATPGSTTLPDQVVLAVQLGVDRAADVAAAHRAVQTAGSSSIGATVL